MNLLNSFQTALLNLRVNKMRSALTMLGVIIGVSAVILMVGIVEGARSKIVSEFQRLGSNLIIVVYQPNREERKESKKRLDGLTMDDVRAIQAECDKVKSLSAEIGAGDQTAHYLDREMQVRPNGVQPDYSRLRDVTISQGRFLSEEDAKSWGKVAVIGSKVKNELFPKEDPIGKSLDIMGVNLTVVGVLEPKGRSGGEDSDTAVLLPIATMQKRFIGSEVVGVVWAQPTEIADLDPAMDQIWECLMRHHENAPGFHVDSQQNILNTIGRILTIFGLLLGGVAGLALLVGGIGIMNIMLVSVTERTREIGIRKAVGARRQDILLQFLIESATVSGVGGLIGIGIGTGGSWLVGFVSQKMFKNGFAGDPGLPTHVPLWAIMGAFLFSAFVGVFFGIYPAFRAARLDPIQALRHE